MRTCPKCHRDYTDDSLRFCLEDGVPLISGADTRAEGRDSNPPSTAVMYTPAPTVKSSAGPTVPTYPSYSSGAGNRSQTDARQSNPLLTVGVVAIAVLLLALVCIAGFFVLRQPATDPTQAGIPNPKPAESPNRKSDPAPVDTKRTADDIITAEPTSGTPLKITASASSIRLAVQSNTYYGSNAIDGRKSTAWIEGTDGPGIGEWIRFDFDREIVIHRILFQPGYFKSPQIWASNNRLATVTAQFSDGTSRDLAFGDRMESQKVDIGTVKTKWVRFVIKSVYYGTDPDTALSEVAFEWEP